MNYFKIAGRAIIILWVIMMCLLIGRHYFGTPIAFISQELPSGIMETREEWMGIYLKDVKIGYSMTRMDGDPEKGYRLEEWSVTNLTVMGSSQRVTTALRSVVKNDLSLISFTFHISSGLMRFAASGDVEGKQLKLRVNTEGRTRRRSLT